MLKSQPRNKIAENFYNSSKKIVKELAENFQLIDNEFQIIVDQVLEWNMPLKLNPLLAWHEVDDPIKNLHIDEFTGERLPRTPKESSAA